MACAIGSTSALASGTRTNSTVTAPTGIANGNVLVYALVIGGASGGVTATAPSGFTVGSGLPTLFDGDGLGDTYAVRTYLWWKIASGESGNYTATHSSADTTAFMWRISGNVASSPSNPSPTTVVTLAPAFAGATCPVPTLTTPSDGSALLWVGASWDAWAAQSPSAGFTERRNVTTEGVYVQDAIQAVAGATGTVTVTIGQSTGRPKSGVMMCIEASVGGGAQDTPELYGRPDGNRGQRQMHNLLAF